MKPSPPLEIPTPALATAYISRFDTDPQIVLTEQALATLLAACPSNSRADHVLLKVVTLNRLYATNIYDVFGVATRITNLNPGFENGADELVEQIARPMGRGRRRHYSFATKYCSWHAPGRYVLYDSKVEQLLWDYQQQHRFGTFRRGDLRSYPPFKQAVEQFRAHFHLEALNFKQLDKFLWTYAKERYP